MSKSTGVQNLNAKLIILGYTRMTNQTKFELFENVYYSPIQIHSFVIFSQPKIQ